MLASAERLSIHDQVSNMAVVESVRRGWNIVGGETQAGPSTALLHRKGEAD